MPGTQSNTLHNKSLVYLPLYKHNVLVENKTGIIDHHIAPLRYLSYEICLAVPNGIFQCFG